MFKPKTPISGRLDNSSGEWIRTTDLRVMSPTSYLCSTPHPLFGPISLPITASACCQLSSGLRVAMYADETINRQGDQDASVGIVQVAGNALGGLDDLIHHLI